MKSSKTDREKNLISKGVSVCSECIFNRKKLIVKTSKNSAYSAHFLLNINHCKNAHCFSYEGSVLCNAINQKVEILPMFTHRMQKLTYRASLVTRNLKNLNAISSPKRRRTGGGTNLAVTPLRLGETQCPRLSCGD